MASTLRVFPTPAALRGPGVLGRGFRRAGLPVFRRNCDAFRYSVRCSVEDSAVAEDKKDVAVHAETSSSHLDARGEDSVGDPFGGWYGVEEVEKNTWKLAAMQVATGFLLALGVSLSYYVWCQKKGRSVIPTPPTLTQLQLPSFLKRSPQEPEHSNHEGDLDEEKEENTVTNSFGKQSEKSLQSDKGKDVGSEDVEIASNKGEHNGVDGEKQVLSDKSDDETQRAPSIPASKSVTSPQDQEKSSEKALGDKSQNSASEPAAKSSSTEMDRKISSGASKDEPKLSASEPAAESTSLQLDRKTASDVSKDEPRPSVAESTRESENSRRDTKKIQKRGNDETQVASSQPRKPRKSQRNKKKFSATQGRRGKVVVPAAVDHVQEQALAVLQALKIVEEGSDPRAICKRRDYARWIIASSSTLTRSPAHKVFPAMYIEGATELAFADVTSDDPDFAYIQGLAEAGLLPSNFSLSNGELGEEGYDSDLEEMKFYPDSPVSRQDLVSWKMALGRRSLPSTDKEALQAKSGFLDIDQIESTLWPVLSLDLDSGENSIITSAFGLTRRFQPDKAATIGQAAIALAHGDSSERFGEELARLQAERMADVAVAADEASEAQKQKELSALFDGQLSAERQQKEQAQKLFEELKAEFEKVKEERDAEKDVLQKDKATVKSEKELLLHLIEEVDNQLQALSTRVMEVSVEQEKLKILRLKSESDEEELSRLMSEVEVEKQALLQARFWAEDEARKARTHAEALEQTRKQRVSREQEGSTSERSWRLGGMKAKSELENFLQRAPLQDVMDKGEDLKANVSSAVIQSWQTILRVLNGFLQRVGDFLREVRWKTQHYYHVTSSSTGNLLQDSASTVSRKFQDLQVVVSQFSTRVGDGTKNFANECKVEVRKLSRRFKNE